MVFPDFFFHLAFFFVSPFRIEDLRVGVRTGDGGGHNERYKGKGVAYKQGARTHLKFTNHYQRHVHTLRCLRRAGWLCSRIRVGAIVRQAGFQLAYGAPCHGPINEGWRFLWHQHWQHPERC